MRCSIAFPEDRKVMVRNWKMHLSLTPTFTVAQAQTYVCLLAMWEESASYIIHGMGFPLNKNFLYEKRERVVHK